MACRGVHFAIKPEEADRLLSAASDAELLVIIQEEIEERWDSEWLAETDKAWDAIHRCLTDDTLGHGLGQYPLNLAILGGQQLYRGDAYIVALVTPVEANEVADALAGRNQEWLRERYDAIDENDYEYSKSEEDFEYSWDYFVPLAPLFRKAANAGRYLVFTVDQ